MTLGNVYDLDLKRNEALIKEVIIQAQGEVNLNLVHDVFQFLTLYASKDGTGGIYQAS